MHAPRVNTAVSTRIPRAAEFSSAILQWRRRPRRSSRCQPQLYLHGLRRGFRARGGAVASGSMHRKVLCPPRLITIADAANFGNSEAPHSPGRHCPPWTHDYRWAARSAMSNERLEEAKLCLLVDGRGARRRPQGTSSATDGFGRRPNAWATCCATSRLGTAPPPGIGDGALRYRDHVAVSVSPRRRSGGDLQVSTRYRCSSCACRSRQILARRRCSGEIWHARGQTPP